MLEIITERKHSSPHINMDGNIKHFVHASDQCVMLPFKICSQLCACSLFGHQDCNLAIEILIKELAEISLSTF